MSVKEDIALLDSKVTRLKVEYEQYFMRIIKLEPARLRDEVDRIIRYYSVAQINNTSLKFKFNSVVSRYNSYKQYWARTMREIDSGTYTRRSEVGGAAPDMPPGSEREWTEPAAPGAETAAESAESRSKEPIGRPERREPEPTAQAQGTGGLDRDYVRGVFDSYMKARRDCNESTDGISFDKMAKTIEKNIKAVEERYKTKDVELKVAVEGGHAKLKITPKKG